MRAPFIGICSFVRYKVPVPNAKEMEMLVRWYWLGTYRPGYLSAWLFVSLALVGHSCKPRHLSAWLLISLVACRHLSAWLLVDLALVGHSCRPRHL